MVPVVAAVAAADLGEVGDEFDASAKGARQWASMASQKEQYGQDLMESIRDLRERLKSKQYRYQPIRRVHLPKAQAKTRPIGISSTEDKVVQGAVREVLEAVYEQASVRDSRSVQSTAKPHRERCKRHSLLDRS